MRRGDVSLALIFSLVCFIAIAAFLQSSQRAAVTSDSTRREYTEHYNRDTLCKLAVQYTLSAVSSQSVTVPTTPLNSTVYAYEPALVRIMLPSNIAADELLQIIGNPIIAQQLSPYLSDADIFIETSAIAADYGNKDNRLYFEDGDRLHLEPLTISLIITHGSAVDSFDYEISGLVCEVQHVTNSFKIKIDDREAVIH